VQNDGVQSLHGKMFTQ